MEGYVYIMSNSVSPGVYKIGKSKEPKQREKTLLHDTPYITLYKVLKTSNYSDLEIKLHQVLIKYRKRGEWFELPNEILNLIIDIYGFDDVDTLYKPKINGGVVNNKIKKYQDQTILIKNIKMLMTARGYTQSSLARELGKQSVVINRALRGKSPFPLKCRWNLQNILA